LQFNLISVRIAPAEPLQCGAAVAALASWEVLHKGNENNFKNPRLPVSRGFFVFAERILKIF
jgi:hypothetical protein